MSAAAAYLRLTIDVLETLAKTQGPSVEEAAAAVADCLATGHRIFVAETSHVLHTELHARAGGLAALHPLGTTFGIVAQPMLETSSAAIEENARFTPERGDVVLIGTNAGTDAGTVEVAVAARAAGCVTVGLTNVLFERWPEVVQEHPSGIPLGDSVDIVVDIGGAIGDGIVDLSGLDTSIGPTSGVALCAAAWAILVRAAELLLQRGLTPIVYKAVQMPGAEELFRERAAAYAASRVGVLEREGA